MDTDGGGGGRAGNAQDLPVVVLENEYLRAAITPQWGGKIWSLYHKVIPKLYDR